MKATTVLLLLTLAGLSMPVQAAEPQSLSCEGTKTGYGSAEPQKLSTNLLLNFTAEKVESSEPPFLNGGKIVQVTEKTVYLDSQIFKDDKLEISTGSLERATGVLVGDAVTYKGDIARADRIVGGYRFSLKCAPVQR
jgi:hypothetical protein